VIFRAEFTVKQSNQPMSASNARNQLRHLIQYVHSTDLDCWRYLFIWQLLETPHKCITFRLNYRSFTARAAWFSELHNHLHSTSHTARYPGTEESVAW